MRELIRETIRQYINEIRPKVTDDQIRQRALKFDYLGDFQKKDYYAYLLAQQRGQDFFDEVTQHMGRRTRKLTPDIIRDVAKKYETINSFAKGDSSAYYKARSFGKDFFEEITSHMKNPFFRNFTDDSVKQIARKYPTKTDFLQGDRYAYNYARKRGKDYYNDVTSHMVGKISHNENTLRSTAAKYKSLKDFKNKESYVYFLSKNLGEKFLDEITKHMVKDIRPKIIRTDDEIRQIAQKYKSKMDFRVYDNPTYQIALKRGEDFYKDITKHMGS